MGTSPTTEVHGYHRSAVLGLDNAFVFDHHVGTFFCHTSAVLCIYIRRITVSDYIVSYMLQIDFLLLHGIELHALLPQDPRRPPVFGELETAD